ncbi:MAG: zinc ribbon domain-containing protein [Myxococcales bacterium]|nr:zinc ribbon domain-containing protein [Myxococcales bacterium]
MTYEYVCEACGHHWEADQKMSEAPLKKCPSCGKPKAKRQISGGAGFVLKGGGWYADGYASKGGSGGSGGSDSGSGGGSGGDKGGSSAKKTQAA